MGCAGEAKLGLEIMGIGVTDIDVHNCMMLRAVQTPLIETLKGARYTLIDWYKASLLGCRDELLKILRIVTADTYYSVKPFADGLADAEFCLTSRFRSNVNLKYLYTGPKTGKKGTPRKFDGIIDVKNPASSRMEIVDAPFDDGKYYTLVAYASALKRRMRLVLFYPTGESACKIYFSTDTDIPAADNVEYYRCRFQIEFCFPNSKQFVGLCDCQSRSIEKLDFHFNASFYSINAAKIFLTEHSLPISTSSLKSLMYNAYITHRIISLCGYRPHKSLIAQIFKELFFIAAPAA